MRRLSLILVIPLIVGLKVVILGSNTSDSPHGKSLKISCEVCHTSSGWIMDENNTFDHATTNFFLAGQHVFTDCRSCHPTLVFSAAGTSCVDCHTDMHEQTLGMHCERCHTEDSWLVSNIMEIHQMSRFPLVGSHASADCQDCHHGESLLKFEPLGVDCYSCHSQDYLSTTFPNHSQAGYSTSCEECHNINSFEWSATGINHSFFPLTGGHSITDCASCHDINNYSAITPDCYACHAGDYTATTNPNHTVNNFSTDCNSCHTTNPGWRPASFEHTFFPLAGVHGKAECVQCHLTDRYADASSLCFSCHASDYNGTSNPNHGSAGFSTECEQCHSTEHDWKPATFDHSFFPLEGVHNIADCLRCHTSGNYSDASSACYSCHAADYNSTSDPKHSTSGFSTDCELCHTLSPGWKPSTFDHNAYFPIYSGKHRGEWNSCSDCHTNSSNYAVFSCTDCHEHNKQETDGHHDDVRDYIYTSTACYSCHPDGRAGD